VFVILPSIPASNPFHLQRSLHALMADDAGNDEAFYEKRTVP
jgi:hypothetical protein